MYRQKYTPLLFQSVPKPETQIGSQKQLPISPSNLNPEPTQNSNQTTQLSTNKFTTNPKNIPTSFVPRLTFDDDAPPASKQPPIPRKSSSGKISPVAPKSINMTKAIKIQPIFTLKNAITRIETDTDNKSILPGKNEEKKSQISKTASNEIVDLCDSPDFMPSTPVNLSPRNSGVRDLELAKPVNLQSQNPVSVPNSKQVTNSTQNRQNFNQQIQAQSQPVNQPANSHTTAAISNQNQQNLTNHIVQASNDKTSFQVNNFTLPQPMGFQTFDVNSFLALQQLQNNQAKTYQKVYIKDTASQTEPEPPKKPRYQPEVKINTDFFIVEIIGRKTERQVSYLPEPTDTLAISDDESSPKKQPSEPKLDTGLKILDEEETFSDDNETLAPPVANRRLIQSGYRLKLENGSPRENEFSSEENSPPEAKKSRVETSKTPSPELHGPQPNFHMPELPRSIITENNIIKLKCSDCDNYYARNMIKQHERMSHGFDRLHKCPFCDYICCAYENKRFSDLFKHMKSAGNGNFRHTKKKVFKCYCGFESESQSVVCDHFLYTCLPKKKWVK